jgi:nucleotidyltransferase/DNA polymerase involved in DNA repair
MLPSSSLNTGIACVYIPRFAVGVERQRRPHIAARLVLIGEATVLDGSLGGDALGVRRGMRMSEAVGLCPRAVVLPPDLPHYEHRFEEVLDFFDGFSPEVEAGDLGVAFLSLDGLSGDPQTYADRIIAGLHRRLGFVAAVGVASGKFTALVAAKVTRSGLAKVVPPGQEAAFLAPLPIDHLPAGESMRWRLRILGLDTIGDIACLPLGAFQQQFGPEGKRWWEMANGIDEEPLVPRVREETVLRRLQLPAPAVTLEAILSGLERLLFTAHGDGARHGRWVRKAVGRASLDGGGSWELTVPFREALADPRDAWFAIRSAVERKPPERPVEELEVELVGLSGESGKQATMFEGKGKLWLQVEEAARQLSAQHGRTLIGKVVPVEPWSRIPERRAALVEFDS